MHVVAIVHAPNRVRAQLADIELEVRRVEIPTPARDEVLQVLAVVRFEILVEHVVLALMPHEAFESVGHLLSIQFGER